MKNGRTKLRDEYKEKTSFTWEVDCCNYKQPKCEGKRPFYEYTFWLEDKINELENNQKENISSPKNHEDIKKAIDEMDYKSMLALWSSNPRDPMIQGKMCGYFSESMMKKYSELSKDELDSILKC